MRRRLTSLRILCFLAGAFLLLSACLLPSSSAKAEDIVTINVYNWGQFMADGSDGYIDVISEFEKAYPNIRVNYMTFDSNETMLSKMEAGGSTFDVIVPSDYMVESLIQQDLLEPLDFSNIPNFKYVDKQFRNPEYDPENLYSVPYTWGCIGVIYNSKYVNEEDAGSWDLLWNKNYAGKILMFDNPRDAFAIAEAYLGYSMNTEDPEELAACTEKLKEQKNLVQSYVMDQIFDKLEREEAWIGPYYCGDYLLMVEENEDLEFFYPEEGYNLFVDAVCIPKGCQHKEEAETFINFLLDPEINGQNMEWISYSSPETAAKEYMDPEFANSDIINPDEEVLANSEMFRALSIKGMQEMNRLWLSVKTDENVLGKYLIITGAALVLVIGLWLFFLIRKKRAISRRGKFYASEK
ncbi:MAG: spermidine/putrescine ABC transporter substrate-binding protein [Parasporobacterium sp.]|nr:spermidine/putrescine ABC transporter substrate-binding protein [Parasporobacterium sp.]